MLRALRPSFAVLLSPSPAASEDLQVLSGHTVDAEGKEEAPVRTFVFRSTLLDPERRFDSVEDPTGRILESRDETRWGPLSDREYGAIPYSYVMQRLVGEWSRNR
jgi:hypothetical protein